MKVKHDHACEDEEDHVVDAEHHFIPGRGRPGHQLSEHVLRYQHEPDEPIGVRKDVTLITYRQGTQSKARRQCSKGGDGLPS